MKHHFLVEITNILVFELRFGVRQRKTEVWLISLSVFADFCGSLVVAVVVSLSLMVVLVFGPSAPIFDRLARWF